MGHRMYTMKSQTIFVRDRLHKIASRLALFVGLMQALIAFSISFLPVFAVCRAQGNNLICHRETYSQQGGNALGYAFLVSMIVAGTLEIISSRDRNPRRAFLIRWLVALSSVLVTVMAGWGYGIAFAPGALLMVLIALMSR